ncbi:hypothetical protein PG990_008415 [Apiospora arundinis]
MLCMYRGGPEADVAYLLQDPRYIQYRLDGRSQGGGRGVYVMNISQGQTKEQFEHFWANTGVPCCEFH